MGEKVTFAGFNIDANGVTPLETRLQAIEEFPTPKNVTDVRLFLGIINQLSAFTPEIAGITEPLRALVRKETAWNWDTPQQEAFEQAKQTLTSNLQLHHYDPQMLLQLYADASRLHGIGYALTQQDDGNTKIIPMRFEIVNPCGTKLHYNRAGSFGNHICHKKM